MENIKVKIWGNENKIVEENLNEISGLLTERVYKNADKILYDIVLIKNRKHNKEIKGSQRNAQIANVLSFLGKRGRGKTSVMFSFCSHLENINKRDIPKWSKFYKEDEEYNNFNCVFHYVDYIDAAMLSDNEYVIDVILAKMWDKFEEHLKKPAHYKEQAQYEDLVKKVKDEFVKVRNAYLDLKSQKSTKEALSASGLHELSVGFNLKENITKLVEDYIQIFNYEKRWTQQCDGYLVLAIDDIDMANGNAWNVLEQIRMYMNIPKVIILLAADLQRLISVCEFSCKKYINEEEAHRFANDYLGKVLPVNMRIYMPELVDTSKMDLQKDESILQCQADNEKDIILELMAKQYNMYFSFNRKKRHFLQNDSLRGLVNYFSKLVQAINNQDDMEWLKNDLQERLIERIEDVTQREFLKRLLHTDYADINKQVLTYISKVTRMDDIEPLDESLGAVLFACNVLETNFVGYTDFVNCILLLYSIILKENKEETNIKKWNIGDSLFGDWEYGLFRELNKVEKYITGSEKRIQLKFPKSDDLATLVEKKQIKEVMSSLFEKEKNQIQAWLYALSYVDIEIVSEQAIRVEVNENVNEKCWIIKPYVRLRKSTFGFLLKGVADYKTILKQLLGKIVTEFYQYLLGGTIEESRSKELEEIKEKWFCVVDDMKWEESGSKEMLIENVEIIYFLGRTLQKRQFTGHIKWVNSYDRVIDKITDAYQIIKTELEDIDTYYCKLGCNQGKFSDMFEQHLQVKVLLEENYISKEVKKLLESYIEALYIGTGTFLNVPNVANKVFGDPGEKDGEVKTSIAKSNR